MEDHRTLRVAEAIREELIELIDFEMEDPRISNVSVTEVLIDPGLREARVRLSLDLGYRPFGLASPEALLHARGLADKHNCAEL